MSTLKLDDPDRVADILSATSWWPGREAVASS